MQLGVSLVDPEASWDELARVAELADQLGFQTIWTNESFAREAFVTLTHWASRTDRAVLATGISPIALRPPFMAAMAAASLAEAVGRGRFWFGIGSGSGAMAARWLGMKMPSPLTAVREYVTIVRALLRGEEVTHDGEAYSLAGASLQLPPTDPPPVLVAALGPRMIDVACETSDGILLNWNGVDGLRDAGEQIDKAKPGDDFITATYVRVAVSDDEAVAIETLRREFAAYVRFPSYRAQLAARGYPDVAEAVGADWGRDDAHAAAQAIPTEVALEFGVAGSRGSCRDQLAAYEKAGIDHIVVRPVPVGAGGLEPAVRAAAELL